LRVALTAASSMKQCTTGEANLATAGLKIQRVALHL
jgi:hypothetical protein